MRIALIGYGNVGKAFVRLVMDKQLSLQKQGINLDLLYVINSSGGIYNPKGINYSDLINYSNSSTVIYNFPKGGSKNITIDTLIKNKDIDLAIELTPTNKDTGEPGITFVKKLLSNKIHVVTGNKGPILLAFQELNSLAINNNVQLGIGCTTGGALPSINGGIMDLAGANILKIEGVLNGTTNFIIEEMEKNHSTYDIALRKAQELGIAETNPSLDVEGWDTATKLIILSNVLMNTNKTLKEVTVSGITSLTPKDICEAKNNNYKLKLVGRAYFCSELKDVNLSVKLEKVHPSDPLYMIDGKNKGVKYSTDTLGDLTLIGGASGVTAAAASILRDIINIHKGFSFYNFL